MQMAAAAAAAATAGSGTDLKHLDFKTPLELMDHATRMRCAIVSPDSELCMGQCAEAVLYKNHGFMHDQMDKAKATAKANESVAGVKRKADAKEVSREYEILKLIKSGKMAAQNVKVDGVVTFGLTAEFSSKLDFVRVHGKPLPDDPSELVKWRDVSVADSKTKVVPLPYTISVYDDDDVSITDEGLLVLAGLIGGIHDSGMFGNTRVTLCPERFEIHGKGCQVKEHVQKHCAHNTLGMMTITFPYRRRGGNLVVTHGEESADDDHSQDGDCISVIVYPGDVPRKITTVESGYRVSMTFMVNVYDDTDIASYGWDDEWELIREVAQRHGIPALSSKPFRSEENGKDASVCSRVCAILYKLARDKYNATIRPHPVKDEGKFHRSHKAFKWKKYHNAIHQWIAQVGSAIYDSVCRWDFDPSEDTIKPTLAPMPSAAHGTTPVKTLVDVIRTLCNEFKRPVGLLLDQQYVNGDCDVKTVQLDDAPVIRDLMDSDKAKMNIIMFPVIVIHKHEFMEQESSGDDDYDVESTVKMVDGNVYRSTRDDLHLAVRDRKDGQLPVFKALEIKDVVFFGVRQEYGDMLDFDSRTGTAYRGQFARSVENRQVSQCAALVFYPKSIDTLTTESPAKKAKAAAPASAAAAAAAAS